MSQIIPTAIDKLIPGSRVTLRFYEEDEKNFSEEGNIIFLGISGDGDYRQAKFRTLTNLHPGHYDWEGTRFAGHWVYGGDASRLSLVSVDRKPTVDELVAITQPKPEPNNLQGVPLVVWQMKAYLAKRAAYGEGIGPEGNSTHLRMTQPEADLIQDWLAELEKNS